MQNYEENKDYQSLLMLRSHLSILLAIDEERRNKIKGINSEIQKTKSTMDSYLDKRPSSWYEETEETKEAARKSLELKKKLDEVEGKREKYHDAWIMNHERYRFEPLFNFLFYFKYVIAAIVFFVSIALYWIFIGKVADTIPFFAEHKFRNSVIFVIAMTVIVFVLALVLEIVVKSKVDPDKKRDKIDKEYKALKDEYNNLCYLASKKKIVYNNTFGKVLPENKTKYKTCENKIKKYEKQISDLNVEFAKVVEEFRKNKYSIVESDYQYVDYLIFLFNSHRADSLQVALQQLDMERRNVQLINRIDQYAGQVNYSLNKINQAIENQTIALSETFEKTIFVVTKAIIGKIDQTNKKLDDANAKLSKIDKGIQDNIDATYALNETTKDVGKQINRNQEEIARLIHRGNKISARGYDKICDEIRSIEF